MSPDMTDIVPDYMSARVGYRTWQATPQGDLLSLYDLVLWPAKMRMQAMCPFCVWPGRTMTSSVAMAPYNLLDSTMRRLHEHRFRNHHAPMPSCTCGIYALKSAIRQQDVPWGDNQEVWGEVYLWGKIQEHAGGYRAEFAYPKSLITRDATLAPKIAERYGVPCAVNIDKLTASQIQIQHVFKRFRQVVALFT